MLSKSLLVGSLFLWLFCPVLSAQTLLSSFSLKKVPFEGGFHFPYEDENGSAHILLYPNGSDFRVLYLDQAFNLLEEVQVIPEGKRKYTFEIFGFIDQGPSLIIMVQFGLQESYTALIYDKRKRSLKRTGLEIPFGSNDLRTPLFNLDGLLTSVQIHLKSSELVVYRTKNGYDLESDTFLIEVENLYRKMERPETSDLVMITSESGNSLFSNIPQNKIYLYGQKIHFTLEERKQGIVTHVSVDLQTREQQITQYQLPRYTEESILRANSLVYEDLILIAAYQKEGLKLEIHELGEAGLRQAYEFPTEADMDDYFLSANAVHDDGTKLKDKRDLHPHLKKFLMLSVEPTDEGDLWLVVGSVPQMSPAAQTALLLSVSVAGAFMGAEIAPDLVTLTVDPVKAIQVGSNKMMYMEDRYSKLVYRVGAINAADLSLKSKADLGIDQSLESTDESTLPPTPYEKMLVFLEENKEFRETAYGQLIFQHRDGLVKGFITRKKEFKLYYFE